MWDENTLHRINTRLEVAKERINGLELIARETIQNKTRDNKDLKTEQRSSEQCNMLKQPNICITGVPKDWGRREVAKKSEEIMAEKFQNLEKTLNLKIQETYWTLSTQKEEKYDMAHDNEITQYGHKSKILEASRKKKTTCYI